MGIARNIGTQLPVPRGNQELELVVVLDKRIVKKGNRPTTQVLVHWTNSFPEDATWEFLYNLQQRFPNFQP